MWKSSNRELNIAIWRKKYLWSGDDGADLSSSFSRVSDERSWLADGNPAGVPKSKKFVKSL